VVVSQTSIKLFALFIDARYPEDIIEKNVVCWGCHQVPVFITVVVPLNQISPRVTRNADILYPLGNLAPNL
jgi:hypothetical protein